MRSWGFLIASVDSPTVLDQEINFKLFAALLQVVCADQDFQIGRLATCHTMRCGYDPVWFDDRTATVVAVAGLQGHLKWRGAQFRGLPADNSSVVVAGSGPSQSEATKQDSEECRHGFNNNDFAANAGKLIPFYTIFRPDTLWRVQFQL
jgi:hypothetical protein